MICVVVIYDMLVRRAMSAQDVFIGSAPSCRKRVGMDLSKLSDEQLATVLQAQRRDDVAKDVARLSNLELQRVLQAERRPC